MWKSMKTSFPLEVIPICPEISCSLVETFKATGPVGIGFLEPWKLPQQWIEASAKSAHVFPPRSSNNFLAGWGKGTFVTLCPDSTSIPLGTPTSPNRFFPQQ